MSRKENLNTIISSSATLAEECNKLLDFFATYKDEAETPFDISKEIPESKSSIASLCTNINSIDGIIQKFDKSSEYKLVPLVRLTNLEAAIASVSSSITKLTSHISSQTTANGGLRSFNYDNFHGTAKNNAALNFASQFAVFNNSVEALLTAFFEALIILRPSKASYNFQSASNSLAKIIERTQNEHATLSAKISEIEKTSSAVEAVKNEAESAFQEIQRLKNESTSDKQTISDHVNDAAEKNMAITVTHESATSLEAQITEYEEKFQAFDRLLNNRETVFVDGQEKLIKLISEFEGQRTKISEQITRSEQMLKGATVAGLAGNFQEIKSNLTTELNSARRTFYAGIVMLFVSAIPLMMFVFLPVIAPFLKTSYPDILEITNGVGIQSDATGWQYLGQVLARFIILLPAIWFVSFSAIRHSSLFHLREHYSYKYSMAVSVEGFKKEAKGYESEIAAMVLEQLAFNPADKLVASKNIPEGKVPNPFMQYLIKKFQKNVDKLKDEA